MSHVVILTVDSSALWVPYVNSILCWTIFLVSPLFDTLHGTFFLIYSNHLEHIIYNKFEVLYSIVYV